MNCLILLNEFICLVVLRGNRLIMESIKWWVSGNCRGLEWGIPVTCCGNHYNFSDINEEPSYHVSVGQDFRAEQGYLSHLAYWCLDPHLERLERLFSSVAQSCPTLCNTMNRSTPGLPVHCHLPEFCQTRPSSRWCHPAISSSVVPFSSCPQSLPASKSFPMSQLFTSGGWSMEFQL